MITLQLLLDALHLAKLNYASVRLYAGLKHNSILFVLSNHYILSREWRVIVDQVHTNYHGKPDGTIISQV